MRPQQQNRRMRGRGGNNNRKGPNPLTRSYESNGPDVKIRGTAQQIADKYAALARDAQSAGDRVMAENYLQHAEHFNRIIAAAMAQMQPQQQMRDTRGEDFDSDTDEREDDEAPAAASPAPSKPVEDGMGPQPVIEGTPAEVALKEQPVANERQASRSTRTKANGQKAANGKADTKSEKADTKNEEVPEAAKAAEEAEAAPKPKRTTRRTRTRKTDEAAATAETGDTSQASEEAAAQG
ncbi:DUF4167 domain-containing protein [Chelativorans sp. Marseille-P2723]|uniref:DUF4167 domain-containing protein n=1 Tax=Chelativorans sp. Marseille-P2723 TaxID=2709133 RepID=UPI00156FC9F8|nr:DUF4167 domain-containing protein [Chelativorans sp. Marseille-P2723]